MFLSALGRHLNRRSFLKGIVLSAGAASTQDHEAPGAPLSLFRQATDAPGEKDACADLVAAGEALRASKRFAAVERGAALLAAKRQALQDPPVIRALALLRRGLAKPVASPRESFSVERSLSEMSAFRSLGRLLALQQYVLLADGRVPEAIGSAELGMRLARAVQTGPLITGLVGVAISGLTFSSLGAHLDQLSARDSDLLYQVCLEWLRLPDLSPRILEAERQYGKGVLAEERKKGSPEELLGLSDQEGVPADKESQRARQLLSELKRLKASSPEAYDALFTEVEQRLDQLYDRILAEWKKPAWERTDVEAPDDASLAGRLTALRSPAAVVSPAGNIYTREQAQIRLLACHAAIRRYRWEHDRLPASLVDLNLGELVIDPFTGQPLKYEVRAPRYRLTSAGPPAAADDSRTVDGRRPVSVVPGE